MWASPTEQRACGLPNAVSESAAPCRRGHHQRQVVTGGNPVRENSNLIPDERNFVRALGSRIRKNTHFFPDRRNLIRENGNPIRLPDNPIRESDNF